jgi:hypothetical protein
VLAALFPLVYFKANVGKTNEARSLLKLVTEYILMAHKEVNSVVILAVREYAYVNGSVLPVLG